MRKGADYICNAPLFFNTNVFKMKVVKILYQKVFPLAQYVNEKIGVEIELDDQDNVDHAFKTASDLVERWHKELNPHLQLNPQSPISSELPVIQKSVEYDPIPGISVGDIRSCASLVVLDAYKGIIRDNEVLMEHYNSRREELLRDIAIKEASK